MRLGAASAICLLIVTACSTPGEVVPDDMSCGAPDGKNHTWSFTVPQLPLKEEPTYYYRAGDYTVLLQQDIVRAELQRAWLGPRTIQRTKTFVEGIIESPKLLEYRDLYVYSLPDGDLWSEVRYLVVDLILQGKAAIVNPTGAPVERVIAARRKGPGHSATDIFVSSTDLGPILGRQECIAD
jgi:hypothetical protein